jgi:hypothetical protein
LRIASVAIDRRAQIFEFAAHRPEPRIKTLGEIERDGGVARPHRLEIGHDRPEPGIELGELPAEVSLFRPLLLFLGQLIELALDRLGPADQQVALALHRGVIVDKDRCLRLVEEIKLTIRAEGDHIDRLLDWLQRMNRLAIGPGKAGELSLAAQSLAVVGRDQRGKV